MTAPSADFESFRRSVADAVDSGDAARILATIHPVARTVAVEHGAAFRELIAGLPVEIWHNDSRVAAALGGSYRSHGAPRGHSALGYFRAAEDAIATTPGTPAHCLASVLIGHAAALRTLGQLTQARAKLDQALPIISNQLTSVVPIRIEASARWRLEMGMLDLHDGAFDSSRHHLEYANGLAAEHLARAEQIEILGALGLIDAARGDFEHASEYIQGARDLAEGTTLLRSGYGAPALTAELMIANECYLLETAAELEMFALDAASRTEFEPFSLVLQAQLRALEGHLVAALDILNRARHGYTDWDRHGVCEDFAEALRASVLIALAQGDDAWEILRTMDEGEHHAICPARLIGQLRLLHGDLVGADQAIRACEELGEAHAGRTLAEVQLVRASIELQRGNLATSDLNADRSFLQMARTGSRMAVLRVPRASLFALAERATDRRQLPEVEVLLADFVQVYAGAEREVEALSPRERTVLAQVQRGLTVAAIANELYISPNTVKTHLRRLYRKLGVSTRDEAMRAARSLGLDREITRDSPALHRDSSEDAVL